jgi:hypothetical protein
VVAIVLALVPAAWFAAQRLLDDPASPSRTATDLPIPPVSPSTTAATPTPGPTPAAPSGTPSATPPRLAGVPTDAPRRIVAGNLIDSGFDNAVTTIVPATTGEVARWAPRGSPGSPGTDTVYVIGKVLAGGGSAFADLPRLKAGSKVTIRTDSGALTYTVSASTSKRESTLAADPLFTEHVAGRLVLVGIRYDASGNRLGQAVVVTAQLTGAERG